MNEVELVEKITRGLAQGKNTVVGVGDDCAVVDLGLPDTWALLKADAVVEGVHFLPETPPDKIGWKALARCLSDVAAMGGSAHSALITLGLPPNFDSKRVELIYDGIARSATRYQVDVVGGETTLNPGALLISVALLGSVRKDACVLRSGAKAGDALFVTGDLGGSRAGKHLDFEPRLEQGQWLAESHSVTSMIDVSDGIASDLRHILKASGVGAELLSSAIPISRAARQQARGESSAKPPLLAALTDGEDFELLLTVRSKDAVAILDAWKTRFPSLDLTCIGKITAAAGLRLRDENGLRDLGVTGYAHFD